MASNNTVLILLIITLIWIEKSEQNVTKSRLKRYIHILTIMLPPNSLSVNWKIHELKVRVYYLLNHE